MVNIQWKFPWPQTLCTRLGK